MTHQERLYRALKSECEAKINEALLTLDMCFLKGTAIGEHTSEHFLEEASKALSMNPNYLGIVNMVQNFTGLNQVLSQKEVFNLYYSLLPTKFKFYKWIKGEKTKNEKEKAEYLAMHFKVSTREAYDYLKILDRKTINQIIKNYKNETSRKTIQSTKK